MTHLDELVAFIENPKTNENDRESAISKLTIYGYPEDKIKAEALTYWSNYFENEMDQILNDQISILSHLLDSKVLKLCFDDRFEEYKNRKKDLGIEDIQKFWNPLI